MFESRRLVGPGLQVCAPMQPGSKKVQSSEGRRSTRFLSSKYLLAATLFASTVALPKSTAAQNPSHTTSEAATEIDELEAQPLSVAPAAPIEGAVVRRQVPLDITWTRQSRATVQAAAGFELVHVLFQNASEFFHAVENHTNPTWHLGVIAVGASMGYQRRITNNVFHIANETQPIEERLPVNVGTVSLSIYAAGFFLNVPFLANFTLGANTTAGPQTHNLEIPRRGIYTIQNPDPISYGIGPIRMDFHIPTTAERRGLRLSGFGISLPTPTDPGNVFGYVSTETTWTSWLRTYITTGAIRVDNELGVFLEAMPTNITIFGSAGSVSFGPGIKLEYEPDHGQWGVDCFGELRASRGRVSAHFFAGVESSHHVTPYTMLQFRLFTESGNSNESSSRPIDHVH